MQASTLLDMPNRKPGRPREYDADEALDAALDVFWTRGFAGTSLDALSEATGMKRPSLYAAFGNKRAIFDRSLQRFQARMAEHAARALEEPSIDDAIELLMLAVVDIYAPKGGRPRGCLVFAVAPLEAAEDDEMRALVAQAIRGFDEAIQARLEAAITVGELPEGTAIETLAQCVAGQVHSLSLRARCGSSRRALRRMARHGAQFLLRGARS